MVAKLKTECGNQYTAKLEGMLTDISVSKTAMQDYRGTDAFKTNEVELDVTLLTTGHWPCQATSPCLLPASLRDCQEAFSSFYAGTNSGRKLTWQHSHGYVDVRATFKSGKRDLNVTTYQAAMLDLFNSSTTLSLDEIRAGTGIPEAELRRHLLSLCTPKLRILGKSSKEKVRLRNAPLALILQQCLGYFGQRFIYFQ
jgi:cullin 3